MRKPIEGFPEMSREFVNFRDKSLSIKAVLAHFSGDGCEARYVETLYDVDSITKLGVRIEIIYYGSGPITQEFLDSLFTEGVRYEQLMRSALRKSGANKGQNVISRNSRSIGQMTGRSFSKGQSNVVTISQADLMAILGVS
jgi:hypothetical protein